MSRIKSVDKANQEKKIFLRQKKYKNLKRDKFVELGNRGLSEVIALLSSLTAFKNIL